MRRIIAVAVMAILALQAAACGVLIYPERQGQTKGQIDPAVAVLDGAGLLLFIIPGLVAFGVDFMTGAIYLPESKSGENSDRSIHKHVVDPNGLSSDQIERIVTTETGYPIDINGSNVHIVAVENQAILLEELQRPL